jgi:hypothetical protein
MPYFDRFDIVEAYYLYLAHNHTGQGSPEYRRLCRIETKLCFRPAPGLSPRSLTTNGKQIYSDLYRRARRGERIA